MPQYCTSEEKQHADELNLAVWHQRSKRNLKTPIKTIIEHKAEGIAPLCHNFSQCKAPKEFSLNKCQINDGATAVLCERQKHDESLKYLDLEDNDIGDSGVSALADFLSRNESVKKLNVRANHSGGGGFESLGGGHWRVTMG
jgi:hypothetical protein